MHAAARYEALLRHLNELDSLLVAYSGGVDSTLLAFGGHAVLGDKCKAVLATSGTHPSHEADQARAVAQGLGFNFAEVATDELDDPRFVTNDASRCYYCKGALFDCLARIARIEGFAYVADGANADDLNDHRPGSLAAREAGVVSPLQDVGFTKSEIRTVARELGLPNWDKPSMACLASRIPYGEPVTPEVLLRIATAERSLRALGLTQFRVRAHGDLARVEVAEGDLELAWRQRSRLSDAVKAAGFAWVALDVDGYRTGSMNALLDSPDGGPLVS